MLLITKRRKIGAIGGHAIYTITKSEMFPIPNSTVLSNMALSKNENRCFDHSTCKCTIVMLLKETLEINFGTIPPMYLAEYCLILLFYFSVKQMI